MSLEIHSIQDQLKNLITQRDNYMTLFHKCSGAIDILNEQLKMIEDKSNSVSTDSNGEIENGDIES